MLMMHDSATVAVSATRVCRLIWQDDEHNLQIPILIFEDHPSILHTETSGQFHLLTSLITQEFQMPPSNSSESHQQEDTFDPLTFFVTVGIAYLDFLEDQEVRPDNPFSPPFHLEC